MAVKIVIKRQFKKDTAQKAFELINNFRREAMIVYFSRFRLLVEKIFEFFGRQNFPDHKDQSQDLQDHSDKQYFSCTRPVIYLKQTSEDDKDDTQQENNNDVFYFHDE